MNYKMIMITDYSSDEFKEAFTAYFNEIGINLKKDTDLWDIMSNTKDLYCYAIKDLDCIIGFIMFQKEIFNSSNDFFVEHVGYIRELYVRKKYRKSGIGKLLINKAEDFFRKNAVYKLILTYEDNAIGFYKKLDCIEDKSYIAKNKQNVVVKIIRE